MEIGSYKYTSIFNVNYCLFVCLLMLWMHPMSRASFINESLVKKALLPGWLWMIKY